MLKKTLLIAMVAVMLAAVGSLCGYCEQVDDKVISADVPAREELTVSVFRVDSSNNWNEDKTNIEFGTLAWDEDNSIFTSSDYYVLDVGIEDNWRNWNIAHTTTSIGGLDANNTGTNLDDNVNVTFVKQTGDTTSSQISKVTFANSGSFTSNKAALEGGWLRIYYGIADGGTNDAPGAEPVTIDTYWGRYQGSVTLTLTSN